MRFALELGECECFGDKHGLDPSAGRCACGKVRLVDDEKGGRGRWLMREGDVTYQVLLRRRTTEDLMHYTLERAE